MGNTVQMRREGEITILEPHLGDLRCQELKNSPFWPTPLFKSQQDALRESKTLDSMDQYLK